MTRTAYPSDLSDGEWYVLEPPVPEARPGGRPRSADMREVLNGIFYTLRGGCAWRMMPHDGLRQVISGRVGLWDKCRLRKSEGLPFSEAGHQPRRLPLPPPAHLLPRCAGTVVQKGHRRQSRNGKGMGLEVWTRLGRGVAAASTPAGTRLASGRDADCAWGRYSLVMAGGQRAWRGAGRPVAKDTLQASG